MSLQSNFHSFSFLTHVLTVFVHIDFFYFQTNVDIGLPTDLGDRNR